MALVKRVRHRMGFCMIEIYCIHQNTRQQASLANKYDSTMLNVGIGSEGDREEKENQGQTNKPSYPTPQTHVQHLMKFPTINVGIP